MKTINQEDFTKSLGALLKETFEGASTAFGTMYLNEGTGFFQTIENLDAETASGGIAAHCEHTRFYLEFLTDYLNENYKMVDWNESWKTKTVDEKQWNALRGQLQKSYQKVNDMITDVETWNDFKISGALGILAHTAYHLSAIRQMLK
jgi:hypothetical protein